MIWDAHCHLSGVPGGTPAERLAQLVTFADRMGIDRLCVYMGFPWSLDPSPDELRKENDQVLQALSHWHHRAFGFAYVSGKHVEALKKAGLKDEEILQAAHVVAYFNFSNRLAIGLGVELEDAADRDYHY